jgi:hypothetical protein
MKEAFLHYVWQYQQFQAPALKTTQGEEVTVLKTGYHNVDAGPDFLEAKLKIGSLEWSGAVEIHINSSDWQLHKHDNDPNYQNVILHVVWADNHPISYGDGKKIPTLILQNRVSLQLVDHYKVLVEDRAEIACGANWQSVDPFRVSQMLESSLVERLQQKSQKAAAFLEYTADDWEATSYFMLLSAFGFKINAHGFERLAYLLPYDLIRKYRMYPQSMLALLFGVSGFLEASFDETVKQELKKDWKFLQHKHQISNILAKHEWNFLRLRPANFPTVRLAQLAHLLGAFDSLFNAFLINNDVSYLKQQLQFKVKNIWYIKAAQKVPWINFGKQSIQHLILNISPPLLALYARKVDNFSYMDKAFEVLSQLNAEDNKILRKYKALGEKPKSAYESQAFLQLYSSYCQPKRCLNCKIGLAIMKDAS